MNWEDISKQPGLTEEFMRENKDKLDWIYVSRMQRLSIAFVKEFMGYIEFEEFSYNPYITEEHIQTFASRLKCAHLLVQRFPLQDDTFQIILPNIDWEEVGTARKKIAIGTIQALDSVLRTYSGPSYSSSLLLKTLWSKHVANVYEKKGDWYRIGTQSWVHGDATLIYFNNNEQYEKVYQKPSISLLQTYQTYIDWHHTFNVFSFSEEEMKNLASIIEWDKHIWFRISHTQKLSESFMETYRDKLSWK